MRLALLSDLHANRQALDACLDHARAQGVDWYAFLGDLVGYGADPVAVVEQVMALYAQGALVIQGNHDAMAVTPPTGDTSTGSSTAQWTHEQLNGVQREFLAHLPLTASLEHLLLVHASADKPEAWRYVDSERAATVCLDAARARGTPGGMAQNHIVVGHVHHQTLYYQGAGRDLMPFKPTVGVGVPVPRLRACVATVGSVGQPRDGDPRAMYAIYDLAAGRLTFHRVAYDHAAAAAAIRQAGLPEYFAQRLETGR
jgi:diadenosine tetraphosphatase ApaH/serine/threonine PP2A family protein phosphatase